MSVWAMKSASAKSSGIRTLLTGDRRRDIRDQFWEPLKRLGPQQTMPRLVQAQPVAMDKLPKDKSHDRLDRCSVLPVHGGFDLSRIDSVQPEALYRYRGFDDAKHSFHSRRYVASVFEHLPDGRVFAIDPVTDLTIAA